MHQLGGNPKIRQFDISKLIDEDVASLNVSVDSLALMQVFQSHQRRLQYRSYMLFSELRSG